MITANARLIHFDLDKREDVITTTEAIRFPQVPTLGQPVDVAYASLETVTTYRVEAIHWYLKLDDPSGQPPIAELHIDLRKEMPRA